MAVEDGVELVVVLDVEDEDDTVDDIEVADVLIVDALVAAALELLLLNDD